MSSGTAQAYKVVGPPGTGKTRYVARQVAHAAAAHGSDHVLVASLTRAAAREAAGRDLPIPDDRVGTLHALCLRSLGRPMIVEAKHLKEWNAEYPDLAMASTIMATEDEVGTVSDAAGHGSEMMQMVDLRRARMEPESTWTAPEVDFIRKWSDFKRQMGLSDFTDLLEQVVENEVKPPGNPGAIFIDEAQDFGLLEFTVVDWWARCGVEQLVMVGDPWQSLFAWRGASPTLFDGRPHAVLHQSYRVPRWPKEVALSIIRQSGDWRDDIEYNARDEEGEVRRAQFSYHDGHSLVELVESLPEDRYPRVMVIASCEYMLEPAKRAMREYGIMYGNPASSRWNPISDEARRKVQSILAGASDPSDEEDRYWTAAQAREVVECLASRINEAEGGSRAGAVIRGGRKIVNGLDPETATPQDAWQALKRALTPEASRALLAGDLTYVLDNMRRQPSLEYAIKCIIRTGDRSAVTKPPRVTLGTIHSVKGAEADAVIVYPDLSYAGHRSFMSHGWAERDSIFRLFYVAVTRTKDLLVLARPGGQTRIVI